MWIKNDLKARSDFLCWWFLFDFSLFSFTCLLKCSTSQFFPSIFIGFYDWVGTGPWLRARPMCSSDCVYFYKKLPPRRDSISRPIAPISSLAGRDDSTRQRRQWNYCLILYLKTWALSYQRSTQAHKNARTEVKKHDPSPKYSGPTQP
jgi:hypothetical protein